MHIDDLYAASKGDAAYLACMSAAGGNSIARGDCKSAWKGRWNRDWFGHPFQLTGSPEVFGTRETNANQNVRLRGSEAGGWPALSIYGVPWDVMAAIPQPTESWIVPRCVLMAGFFWSDPGGGLSITSSINAAPRRSANKHCRWVE